LYVTIGLVAVVGVAATIRAEIVAVGRKPDAVRREENIGEFGLFLDWEVVEIVGPPIVRNSVLAMG
jgi:hypothetical protein